MKERHYFDREHVERIVIWVLINSRRNRNNNIGRLDRSAFANKFHRALFSLVKRLRPLLTIDILRNELNKKRSLSDLSKKKLIAVFERIRDQEVEDGEPEYAFDELEVYARADKTIFAMERFIHKAKRGRLIDAEEQFSKDFFKIRNEVGGVNIEVSEVMESLPEQEKWIRAARDKDIWEQSALFGVADLDKYTHGMFPGEMVLVFGFAGVGKSILMMEAAHINRILGKNVLVITLEMPREQVLLRYSSRVSKLFYRKRFKFGDITDKQIRLWKRRLKQSALMGGKLYIANMTGNCTVGDIERLIETYEYDGIKFNLVIIDFLDLISSGDKSWSEQHELGKISRAIKLLAIDKDIPILTATHQKVRGGDLEDEEPGLTDVGYSQRKIQFCDMAIAVYQTAVDKEEGLICLKIAKGRDTKPGIVIKAIPDFDRIRYKSLGDR